jgi:DHA1 family bicyclomycin/chloramphenicol resistance-like MFS transporter
MQLHQHRQLAPPSPATQPLGHGLSYVEFIGLVAMMMALTALSIDMMLPALPLIGDAMGVSDPNDRQIIIISYVLGFSVGQLGYGRLSDRYGRKPVLMFGLAVFVVSSLVASLSSSFLVLLAARTVQGLGAAAPRVIAIAIVRDLYAGRQMARVMSFAMTVFIIIPVLAPSLGQGLLEVGTWRLIFDALLLGGLILAAWAGLRLPETRTQEDATHPLPLGASLKLVLETPETIGYALGGGFMFGCLMGYVSTAQQVFVDIFHLGAGFPIAFGAVASLLAVASLANAALVERLGMRLVSHSALTAFLAASLLLTAAAATGLATLPVFLGLMSFLFFAFGLIAPNFNALAMEPQGHNAGMASSVVGFTSTGAGAVCGGIVGHFFDGSVLPLALGFLCLCLAAVAVVLWIEGPSGLYRPAR